LGTSNSAVAPVAGASARAHWDRRAG